MGVPGDCDSNPGLWQSDAIPTYRVTELIASSQRKFSIKKGCLIKKLIVIMSKNIIRNVLMGCKGDFRIYGSLSTAISI